MAPQTAANTLSAFGRFNQWAVGAVRFQPIQPVGGAHVCKLLLQGGGGGGRHSVPKVGGGGGGGGGGGHGPPPPGDAHAM